MLGRRGVMDHNSDGNMYSLIQRQPDKFPLPAKPFPFEFGTQLLKIHHVQLNASLSNLYHLHPPSGQVTRPGLLCAWMDENQLQDGCVYYVQHDMSRLR